jgi:tRNA A-37 threonylcarbamoyl transferase component Bud32
MWLSLAKEFTDKNEGTMEGILRSSYFSVVEHVWAGIHLTTSLLQVEETCKYLKNLSTIQHFDLVNEDMQSIIFKNLERTLYFEFDIDGLRALQGEQLKPDFSQGKSIVDCLSQLNLSKEDQESLKKISLHFQLEEDLYQEPPKSCPNIHKLADLSQISFGDLFYAQETSQFYVRVYRGSHPQVGQIAIKEYIAKNLEIDLQKFQSEIDILEKLSSLSSVETCFLKFYGNWLNGKNLYLVMEYHPYTLMSIISVYKQQNYNISEKDLSIIIKKLLHSFAIMESMGIYHKDIKPHNILVSNDFEFKIIDFSISEIKEQIDTTLPTDFNVIQGTSGYVAPELQKLLEKGERNGTYNVAKADVFSLGLTILQIICMEDFGMLNHEEYNERLMKKVEQVKINWIRLILEKMLHVDYSQRKSFKYLVSMVPQDKTQIT